MTEISMSGLVEGAKKLGVTLDSYQLNQFEIYYRNLVDWNERLNLTAITEAGEVQAKHFMDSLTLLPLIKGISMESLRIIDAGTGAGFPGIPIKIAMPDVKMALLEVTTKKARFLEHIITELQLSDIEVINERAEEAGHKSDYRESFDIVVSRAVAELAILAELTLPFCAVGGYLIAQKKGDIRLELENSLKAIEMLGGRLSSVDKVTVDELDDMRYLVIIQKISQTPQKYPRRPGMPEKRPLL
ncbi:MAG: 16S rRNA (guanine(527)-N(7))-methyltransferase RsmG [Dehalococcoidales bacterium]|jgi:16S rRNA (guanine527-N7)-methyltransferase|nr:16S rRNA (guanine(527)-N(7))-methyltransferase RsmG [Dehalococcoidales bacterium]MDD3994762.1 16S rRNA (guanine(527)-N(7))-methyltransferase RsmG [Dehalococcoidales bacterium]